MARVGAMLVSEVHRPELPVKPPQWNSSREIVSIDTHDEMGIRGVDEDSTPKHGRLVDGVPNRAYRRADVGGRDWSETETEAAIRPGALAWRSWAVVRCDTSVDAPVSLGTLFYRAPPFDFFFAFLSVALIRGAQSTMTLAITLFCLCIHTYITSSVSLLKYILVTYDHEACSLSDSTDIGLSAFEDCFMLLYAKFQPVHTMPKVRLPPRHSDTGQRAPWRVVVIKSTNLAECDRSARNGG
ncbi:hypothetical protein CHU98_g6513 [Xylaria longipes]|nr:hypothetical protein CHU98_g6513 [Xylaria longipes]